MHDIGQWRLYRFERADGHYCEIATNRLAPDDIAIPEPGYAFVSSTPMVLAPSDAEAGQPGVPDGPDRWSRLIDERDDLRAENTRMREALASIVAYEVQGQPDVRGGTITVRVEDIERALGICEDAASMTCECTDYYRCNGCEKRIAGRADDAVEVLRAALEAGKP